MNKSNNKTILFENTTLNQQIEIMPYVQSVSIVLVIIFILGITLNMLSIIIILRSTKPQPVYLLILNLALADIVYTAGIPLFVTNIFTLSWPFQLIGCQAYLVSDIVGMTVGVYTVAALSVERYLEVTNKKRKAKQLNEKFKFLIIAFYSILIWLFAFFFGMPMITSVELKYFSDNTYTCDSHWSHLKLNTFFCIKFILVFLVPFTIILFSSVKLLIFLIKWNRTSKLASKNASKLSRHNETVEINLNMKLDSNILSVSKSSDKNFVRNSIISMRSSILKQNHRKQQSEKRSQRMKIKTKEIRIKAIRIVLSIVLLFLIQWIPLWVFELYKAVTNDFIQNIQLINVVITLISYSNSVANPLLYIFFTHYVNLRKYFENFLVFIRLKK